MFQVSVNKGIAGAETISAIESIDSLAAGYRPIPVKRMDSVSRSVRESVLSPHDQAVFVQSAVESAKLVGNFSHDPRMDSLLSRAKNDAGFQEFLKHDPVAKLAVEGVKRRLRMDDAGGGVEGGLYLPYQLTYIAGKLLEQPMPPLNGLKDFKGRGAAGVGAREYAIRRTNKRARAAWAGQPAQAPNPQIGLNQNEIKTLIQYAIASFDCTVFDLASANFANFLLQDNGISAAIRAISELENDVIWKGDSSVNLFGVLAHPYCPRVPIATTFTSSVSSQKMASLLLSAINSVVTQNFTTFVPDRIRMSPVLFQFLQGISMTIGTTGTVMTLLEFVAKNNIAGINEIGPGKGIWYSQELTAAGPGGTEAMFIYGDNEDATRVITSGGVASLPVQYHGVNVTQTFYQGLGGLNMYNPANNALVFVTLG